MCTSFQARGQRIARSEAERAVYRRYVCIRELCESEARKFQEEWGDDHFVLALDPVRLINCTWSASEHEMPSFHLKSGMKPFPFHFSILEHEKPTFLF